MRLALLVITTIGLVGCSTGLSKTGLSTTATTSIATAGVSALLGPVTGVIVGSAAGVATDIVVNETPSRTQIITSTLKELPIEERSKVLKAQFLWESVEKLGMWVILAILAFFLLPLLIGYVIPNKEHRNLRREAFNHPDIKMKDL